MAKAKPKLILVCEASNAYQLYVILRVSHKATMVIEAVFVQVLVKAMEECKSIVSSDVI